MKESLRGNQAEVQIVRGERHKNKIPNTSKNNMQGDEEEVTTEQVLEEGPDSKVANAESTEVDEGKTRAVWQGNFNIYWLIGVALAIWFLFVYAPPRFHSGLSWMSIVHFVGAYSFYLVCIWNIFHTPSHGSVYRNLHVWLGRYAMVLGYVATAFGFYVTWRPGSYVPRSSAIGLSVGGVLQVFVQTRAWYSMRRARQIVDDPEKKQKLIESHAGDMVAAFLLACGIPAAIRLSGQVPSLPEGATLGICIAILVIATPLCERALKKNSWI